MELKVVSFYYDNIPQEIADLQRQVFDKFQIPLEQILTRRIHHFAIEHYLDTSGFDVVVIFDIDCIPLRADVVDEAARRVMRAPCVYGAIQNANHYPGSADYVAPAFMSFSKQTYDLIGRPRFELTERGDVGAEVTYRAREQGVEVSFIEVASVSVPLWRLNDGTMFGHGTNYGDKVFHAFEIRQSDESRRLFVDRCNAIIGL